MSKILIFGASSTYGFWDEVCGGWANRLRNYVDKKNLESGEFFEVFNLGIAGNTSKDILDRFEIETQSRLKMVEDGDRLIFIFSFGTNDSAYRKSKDENNVSPEEYKTNVLKLIEKAENYSPFVIFVGLSSVDEKRTTPIPWAEDFYYLNKNIDAYNAIAKSVCETNELKFINIDDVAKFPAKDGLHQSAKGHEKIFEKVRDYLEENKLI